VHVAITDLEERRSKHRITFPAAIAAVLIGIVMHLDGLPGQLVAGVAVGAFLMLFAVLSRGGLGMGDVKLGVVLGLFLSKYVIVALVVGLLASAVLSIAVLVSRGISVGRKTAIPLGPFLAFGGVVAVLAGPHLLAGT
jgi:leader peptidase (prepilin peptidase) / N-methyltransferase